MLALISFLFIITISVIAVRIGSIALEATGLSKDIAGFQAQSAFSGTGFTTGEAETITSHPARRKIIRFLMLIGSAGLTTAIATLVVTFVNVNPQKLILGFKINNAYFNIAIILLGLLLIFWVFTSRLFDKLVRLILAKPLEALKAKIQLYDYERILGLSRGYTIGSFEVPKRHWMVNKTISELELEKEGIVVLGVYRNVHNEEEYVGTPNDDFKIHNKDKIMVYGKESLVGSLAKREKGAKGTKERKIAEQQQKKYALIKKIDEQKLKIAAKKK